MDKKRFKIILAAFALSLALIIPASYSAGANSQINAAAGSREDPLVTASYIAKYVAEAIEAHSVSYEIVELKRNQRILAKSGALEVIVRPGSRARVTAPNGTGIADVTAGQELVSGNIVSENHLLVIPRADKRGLVILSDTAFLFVRGDYEIE